MNRTIMKTTVSLLEKISYSNRNHRSLRHEGNTALVSFSLNRKRLWSVEWSRSLRQEGNTALVSSSLNRKRSGSLEWSWTEWMHLVSHVQDHLNGHRLSECIWFHTHECCTRILKVSILKSIRIQKNQFLKSLNSAHH